MLDARRVGVVALWFAFHVMASYGWILENDDSCAFREHPVFKEVLSSVTPRQFNVEEWQILNLSETANALSQLEELLLLENPSNMPTIAVLNLSSTGLTSVPNFRNTSGNRGSELASQLRVLILTNNDLSASFGAPAARSQDIDVALSAYDALPVEPRITQQSLGRGEGMNGNYYPELLQLDLRNCSITFIGDHGFLSTPNLEFLYLDRNSILVIESLAFSFLSNLKYLGLSKNNYVNKRTISAGSNSDLLLFKDNVFLSLPSLTVLDLSYTRVLSTNVNVFMTLGANFTVLSLCYSQISYLPRNTFRNTQMKLLDISGNAGILDKSPELFGGIEDTLEILLAHSIGLSRMEPLENLRKLKILNLKFNLVQYLSYDNLKTLPNLVILDFTGNRVTHWFTQIFQHMPTLKYLSLAYNNLSLLSYVMLRDFVTLEYVDIIGNSFVCNCYLRIFIEVVVAHENVTTDFNIENFVRETLDNISMTVDGIDLEDIFPSIEEDEDTDVLRTGRTSAIDEDSGTWMTWNLTFRTTKLNISRHNCVENISGKKMNFQEVEFCTNSKVVSSNLEVLQDRQMNLLYILLGASTIIVPLAGFIVWKWWYIRYFVVMVKNVAMLSLMKKNATAKDTNSPFMYDVFVSYCKGDREWVLSELLVHIEEKSNLNICLHERDFQVGLSILENIITCIDRSRIILLVVSQEFLLSQWCQFEMHLAQHRLLETRREKLIIILLEDIPKRKRPNTLQYLMLTKTYIIWPKSTGLNEKVEQSVFWRRLKKSLLHGQETYDVGTFA